jgi:DNA-directed RNA polymerase subunit H (RpoH/RPB5)
MASQNSTVQVSQIFNSRKIILELMKSQGFNVNDYAGFNINEVNSMIQHNQLDMLLETDEDKITVDKPKKKMYIRYYLSSRPAAKNIQEMIEDLFILTETLTKNDTLFIIIKDDPNETLLNELKHIWESDGIFIIIESIKRLQYNILNHILVPPHIILTEPEVVEIMKRYNIMHKSLFPDISRFDPVARVIGLRPGQVCHIIRDSKTAIVSDYYRICV